MKDEESNGGIHGDLQPEPAQTTTFHVGRVIVGGKRFVTYWCTACSFTQKPFILDGSPPAYCPRCGLKAG